MERTASGTSGRSSFGHVRAIASAVHIKNHLCNSLYRARGIATELTHRKSTTEVVLNTRGFNDFVKKADPETVVLFHTRWLEAIAHNAKQDHAYIERFVGDEVQINFGGITPCPSPGLKAGRYLTKLRERLAALGGADLSDSMKGEVLQLPKTFVGAAQGPAVCGTLGVGDGLQGTAVLGRLVGGAKALQVIAQDTGFDIIVDRRVADECSGHIDTVPVDIVQVGLGGAPQEVCHLLSDVGDTKDEWLYSLSVDQQYDRAWKALRGGDVLHASELLTACASGANGAVGKKSTGQLVAARLQQYVAEVIRVTGEAPKEYCRCVRLLSVMPRQVARRTQQQPAPQRQVPSCSSMRSSRSTRSAFAKSRGASSVVASAVPPGLVPSPSMVRLTAQEARVAASLAPSGSMASMRTVSSVQSQSQSLSHISSLPPQSMNARLRAYQSVQSHGESSDAAAAEPCAPAAQS
eukprot:Rhum_TRINITY_DN14497_c20_g1::Rhum_TRINITY_DN14497_c20_g1_i1::g.93241::m.93241